MNGTSTIIVTSHYTIGLHNSQYTNNHRLKLNYHWSSSIVMESVSNPVLIIFCSLLLIASPTHTPYLGLLTCFITSKREGWLLLQSHPWDLCFLTQLEGAWIWTVQAILLWQIDLNLGLGLSIFTTNKRISQYLMILTFSLPPWKKFPWLSGKCKIMAST